MEVFIKYDNLREACVSAIKGLETYKNITADDMVSPRHLCVQEICLVRVLPWLHKHLKDDLTFQAGIRNYEEVVCPA
ncbi:unnamed protein product, partial [Ranitomeya imitator]